MNLCVIPTKHNYVVVGLPPYRGAWELQSPTELPEDLLVQLRGQMLHKLAEFCHMLTSWQGQIGITLAWAIWGCAALGLRLMRYADIGGLKTIVLYGWIKYCPLWRRLHKKNSSEFGETPVEGNPERTRKGRVETERGALLRVDATVRTGRITQMKGQRRAEMTCPRA